MNISRFNLFSLNKLAYFVLLIGLLHSSVALAQSNEPGQIQRRFEPGIEVPAEPRVQTPPVIQAKQKHKYTQSFTLKSVDFQGVSVYSESELKALAAPYIGKKVTLNEMDALADELLKRYREDGYILVVARVQDKNPENGIVVVQVVEGYISNVVIDGNMKANKRGQALVKEMSQKITEDRPLKASTLERYLLLIDDLPGVTAKGIVRRGDGAGHAELLIVMDHKTYEGSLEINNRGTRFIAAEQAQATLAANSLLGIYDRTVVRAVTTTPTTELRFFDVQHEEQLTAEGTKAKFFASHTDVEPGDSVKALRIEGDATTFDFQVESPVIRTRKENLTPRATLSYSDSEVETLGTTTSKDKLRSVRVGGAYDIVDNIDGVNIFDAEVSQGVDAFGASDKGAGRSRIDGESDYTKFNLDIIRLQPLPHSFSIYTAFTGQYSLDPLLAAEEFTLGSSSFGSAYDPSELTGDHGAALRVELRWANQPGVAALDAYQLYGFYDIGSIWQKDPPTGVRSQESLASAGVGLRANLNPYLSASAEIAKPLTKPVTAEGNDDTRGFFSVIGRF